MDLQRFPVNARNRELPLLFSALNRADVSLWAAEPLFNPTQFRRNHTRAHGLLLTVKLKFKKKFKLVAKNSHVVVSARALVRMLRK